MNCPACKITSEHPAALRKNELEPGLTAMCCEQCAGVLLEHEQYVEWAKSGSEATTGANGDFSLQPSAEKGGAKFCPACHAYLVKYDVGKNLSFSVDRCGKCGGIWLDGNEWSQLKAQGLHRDIHHIFSIDWQSNVRREEHELALKDIWREQFGSDYAELTRIKQWIGSHPKGPEILAFLNAQNLKQSKSLAEGR